MNHAGGVKEHRALRTLDELAAVSRVAEVAGHAAALDLGMFSLQGFDQPRAEPAIGAGHEIQRRHGADRL